MNTQPVVVRFEQFLDDWWTLVGAKYFKISKKYKLKRNPECGWTRTTWYEHICKPPQHFGIDCNRTFKVLKPQTRRTCREPRATTHPKSPRRTMPQFVDSPTAPQPHSHHPSILSESLAIEMTAKRNHSFIDSLPRGMMATAVAPIQNSQAELFIPMLMESWRAGHIIRLLILYTYIYIYLFIYLFIWQVRRVKR